MKAGQGNLLRVALGLHCVLHVVWFGASTPVAEGHGPSAFAEQGSNREVLVDDAVGERSSSTQQAARRMQTTELLDGKGLEWGGAGSRTIEQIPDSIHGSQSILRRRYTRHILTAIRDAGPKVPCHIRLNATFRSICVEMKTRLRTNSLS